MTIGAALQNTSVLQIRYCISKQTRITVFVHFLMPLRTSFWHSFDHFKINTNENRIKCSTIYDKRGVRKQNI